MLNKLKQAIEAQLGPSNEAGAELVTIGDNGNIVINESLVFEYNSYAIKNDAKPLLDTLARALGNVLADADVRANIDTIVIQGHTDERGSASFNWDLSAKRATAVLDYLFEANKTLADSYGSYFAASAYSKFRPINPDKTRSGLPAESPDRDLGHPEGRQRPQGHRRLHAERTRRDAAAIGPTVTGETGQRPGCS